MQKKILEILEKEPEISQAKLAENLSENVNTIKTYIKLKKAGVVERQGSSQKGK